MKSFSDLGEFRRELAGVRRAGTFVGFVPTMGSLHDGHVSLIQAAREGNDIVAVSIFVNPLQFRASEDLDRYPRDLTADSAVAADARVDFLFVPSADSMYPKGTSDTKIEVGAIGEVAEGQYRPGHFSGVATVCIKLFNIVQPDRAYFGQKDAQQVAVMRQVVRDLDLPLEIVVCPTVRASDGLAVSSRNAYLSPSERLAAAALPRALLAARDLTTSGERSASRIVELVQRIAGEEPQVRLEYVQVVDPASFRQVDQIADDAIIVLAAQVGSTRLIDNIVVH